MNETPAARYRPASQGLEASVFVGRAEELATLDAAWERVGQGQPATVLIGGEAGVGKSRLAEEFGARAAGAVRVLSGYCLDLGAEGLPFAPFTGVLRGLVRDLGADGLAALLPGQGARELARLLPELGEPDTQGDPGEARARMFEQILAILQRLAEVGPVLPVIEDAHWSDRSTRDLLTFLVANQRVLHGVLIVVTFRSDELGRGHPLRPVLAELDRLGWVARLELPRLTRREGRELMACLLGREPEPELAERVLRRSAFAPAGVTLACFALGGLIYGPFIPLTNTLLQSSTTSASLPAVLAARSAIITFSSPLGTAIGGPLVSALGAAGTLTASGAATVVLALVTGIIWARPRRPSLADHHAPAIAGA